MSGMTERGVALVTGVASGLGEALCGRLHEAGFKVAGLARSERIKQTLEQRLTSSGGHYHHHCLDVADTEAMNRAVAAIEADLGPIDVLIHNAHQLLIKPFHETKPEEFEAVWRTGCFGAMIAAHAVVPGMAARGRGTVIFTGATAAIRGSGRFSAFASAKFALRGLAQSLAREYGANGVHVVHSILDGLIWEQQTRDRFDPKQEACLDPEAIASAYLHMIDQDPSAWTHELDLRPSTEAF